MNSTITYTPFLNMDGTPDYVALGGYGLFAVSEILPFIRKNKENNGLLHTLICLLKGSKSCCFSAALIASSTRWLRGI